MMTTPSDGDDAEFSDLEPRVTVVIILISLYCMYDVVGMLKNIIQLYTYI